MTRQIININQPNDLVNVGSNPDDHKGDPLRTAFTKLNDAMDRIDANFVDLYANSGGNANTGDIVFTNSEMSSSTDADITLVTNGKTWSLGANGYTELPGGGFIGWDNTSTSPAFNGTMIGAALGNDFNIQTAGGLWKFRGDNSNLTVPGAVQGQDGVVTTFNITDISKDSNCLITVDGNIWDVTSPGDWIYIDGIITTTELNGNSYFIDFNDATSAYLYTDSALTIPVDSTNFSDYFYVGSETANNSNSLSNNELYADLTTYPDITRVQAGWTVSGDGITGTRNVTYAAVYDGVYLIRIDISQGHFNFNTSYTFQTGGSVGGGGTVSTSTTAGDITIRAGLIDGNFGASGTATLSSDAASIILPSTLDSNINGTALEISHTGIGGIQFNISTGSLRVRPTVGPGDLPHIHIEAADPTVNDLILGDDYQNVIVSRDGSIAVQARPGAQAVVWIQSSNTDFVNNATAITAIDLSNPVVVTTSIDHNLTDGDRVGLEEITTTTELNGNIYYAQVLSANTFSLYLDSAIMIPVDGSAMTPYVNGGGVLYSATMPGDVLIAGGADVTGYGKNGDVVISGDNAYIETGENNSWKFGLDGNLTLPNGTVLQGDGHGIQYPTNSEWDLHRDDGKIYIGSTSNTAYIDTYDANINVRIRTLGNPEDEGIGYDWLFNPDGTLKLPGKLWAQASDNGSIGFSNNGVDEHGYIKVDAGYNMVVNSDSDFYIKRAGGDRISITANAIELNGSNGKRLSIANDGRITLPEGFYFANSTGSTILDRLSYFTDDLTITASRLTGTTLASGVTASSLTSVGTLGGLTSSGVVHITNTEDSTNADSGALQVDGGAHITKNLIAEGTIYAGIDAYSEALTNPLIVASAPSGVEGGYSQVAILNNTAEASGDFQVMVDGYDINGPSGDTGWADIGMAGSNFSDPRYTITNPQDGYVFVSALEGGTGSGNLVLGTDSTGSSNDIVFATGGFLVANEKMRISNADGSLTIAGKIKTAAGVGDVVIESNNGTAHTWTFGADGTLTLPQYNTSISQYDGETTLDGGSDDIGVQVNVDKTIYFRVGDNNWAFGAGAGGANILQLPVDGDIVDSNGDTVLGAGNYTLPTAGVGSGGTLGGVKVDGTTIVINGSGVISSTVVGAVTLKGTWDASTNTPELSSSLPAGVQTGWQYLVSVTGTRDIGNGSQTYTAGDIVMFDGVAWVDIPGAAGSVASFNNRTGAVSLTLGDVTTALGFTPYNATNPSSYITSSALSGLATETFVTTQGYITSSGNAATATKLAASVNINGVAFDGSGNITVTAAASTLTGNTLNSGVTQSSLTSVGTLTNLTVTNTISGSVSGAAGSAPAGSLTGNTLASGITTSSLTSVGTLTDLTVTNTISGSISGSAPAGSLTGSTLASGVTASSLTSVGTLTNLTVGGTLARSGNMSQAAWGTSGVGLRLLGATYTDTTSVTSLANSYVHTIGVPTLAFTNTTTVGTAANLYIGGDPVGGTNAVVSSNYSFGLYNNGKTYLGGNVRVAGTILSGGGASMLSFSNSQATFNADVSVSGQLYLPNRPAFRVVGTGGQLTSPMTITSSNWTQDFQQGAGLNGTTGIFTAPYAGLYQVNLVVRAYTNAGVSAQVICKKTAITGGAVTTVVMVEWAANTTMNHTGGSSVIKLAVGDTLKVDVTVGSISFDANDNWSVAFIG